MKLTIIKHFTHPEELMLIIKEVLKQLRIPFFPLSSGWSGSLCVYNHMQTYSESLSWVGGIQTSFHPQDLSCMGARRLSAPLEGQLVGEAEKSERKITAAV